MGQNICNRSDVGDKHLATGTGYLINSIYVIVHLGVVVKLLRIRLNIKRAHDVVQLLFNFSFESLMVACNIICSNNEGEGKGCGRDVCWDGFGPGCVSLEGSATLSISEHEK